MPQATSTFSIARRISALASVKVLPFSVVMMRAMSSMCSSSSIFSLNSGWMRSSGGVRQRNAGQDFAGRRVDHVAPFRGARVGPLAVDVVGQPQFDDGRCGYGHDGTSAIAKNEARELRENSLNRQVNDTAYRDSSTVVYLRALAPEGKSRLRMTSLTTPTVLLRLSVHTPRPGRIPARPSLRRFARWWRPAAPGCESRWSTCRR